METPITLQLYQMGLSLAAGVGLGLVYDLLRALRRTVGAAPAADAAFWCIACAGLFCLGMAPGQGQLRIFMAACAVAGAGAYLALGSPLLLPVLCRMLAFLGRILRFFLRPLGLAGRKLKKFWKTGKKFFPSHFCAFNKGKLRHSQFSATVFVLMRRDIGFLAK